MIKIKVINVDDNREFHAKMFTPGFYKMWKTETHIHLCVYERGCPHHDEAPAELVISGECYPESIKAVDDIMEGKNCTVITYKGQCTVYDGIYGMVSELVHIYASDVDKDDEWKQRELRRAEAEAKFEAEQNTPIPAEVKETILADIESKPVSNDEDTQASPDEPREVIVEEPANE